jgi:hypothetical protein
MKTHTSLWDSLSMSRMTRKASICSMTDSVSMSSSVTSNRSNFSLRRMTWWSASLGSMGVCPALYLCMRALVVTEDMVGVREIGGLCRRWMWSGMKRAELSTGCPTNRGVRFRFTHQGGIAAMARPGSETRPAGVSRIVVVLFVPASPPLSSIADSKVLGCKTYYW